MISLWLKCCHSCGVADVRKHGNSYRNETEVDGGSVMTDCVQHQRGLTAFLNVLCLVTPWIAIGMIGMSTLGCVQAEARPSVVVFADGQPGVYLDSSFADFCSVVQPQDFTGDAPGDLVRCFKLLTGVDLPTEPGRGRIPLRLRLLDWQEDRSSADPLGHQGYVLEVSDSEIMLGAPRGMGVYNAIYYILDLWGCRWIMPGDDGEVIPQKDRLELPVGTFWKNKSMDTRCTTNATADYGWWRARNGCGTERWIPFSHYWPTLVPVKEYFKNHPEYFAMVNGKRVPTQLETANPELVALLIEKAKEWLRTDKFRDSVPMEFNDGLDYSTSPESLALDPPNNPSFMGFPSMSDRLVILANQIGEAIEEEFPDKTVDILGYTHHTLPPVKAKPRDNVIVALTRSWGCIVHLMPREKCPKSLPFWDNLEGWLNVCSSVYTYDWVPIYWAGGLPCPLILEFPHALKKAYAMGVTGNTSEKPARCDASDFVGDYLEWRIKTDPRRDPEAELTELCQVFFGPAGAAMNRYYLALSKATDTSFPEGCFDNGTALVYPELYTPGILAEGRKHLDTAAAAASNATFSRRVKMVQLTFDYLEAFLTGVWEAKKGNYESSVACFDAIQPILKQLHAMKSSYMDLAFAELHTGTARAKTLARYFPDKLRFCRSWQLLGPLDNDNRAADIPDELFPSEVFSESVRIGAPAKLADSRTLDWTPYTSPEGLVEFTAAFADVKRNWKLSHAYAALTVETPTTQATKLHLDSFYAFRVFVNGTQVYHRPGLNQDKPDGYWIPVTLQAGKNEIVLRSSETVSPSPIFRWGFYFRITGHDGNPLPDLKFLTNEKH